MEPHDIAERLRAAYSGAPIDPFGASLADADAAYAVQEINTAHWLDAGRRLVGRKIGLTAATVQAQLGVDQPDYGMLFDDMRLAIGEPLATQTLIAPKIEAEIAFVINGPIDDPNVTFVELVGRIECAFAAIEIVDSRVKDWRIALNDTVADNASSAKFVLGAQPIRLETQGLTDAAMTLTNRGEAVSNGVGSACLGHPLNAVLWLARTMAARGRPLAENDLVLSGALGPMVTAKPGDAFECRIDGFEPLRLVVD